MTIINSNQSSVPSFVNSLQEGTISASFFSFNGRRVSLKEEEANRLFDTVSTLESIYTEDREYRRPRRQKPLEQPQDQDTQDLHDQAVSSDDDQAVSPETTSSDDDERSVIPFCGPVTESHTIHDFAADDSDLDVDFVPDEQIQDETETDLQEELDEDDRLEDVHVEQEEIAADTSYMELRSGKKVYFKPELVKTYHYFPPASRLPLNCR